ncbi:STAS/SEC14 domain-containing protein [Polyangium mundeleinium]|uniref:STAS/SEC14 domain-containing protein n=1 Tax=Polyangium mundeleinium TaxID=2995306 RepID=A0ABT5F6Z7_9BACT|nr:STAS/SEC14 domain-containing protein [Polyangium mundeleinium]MDC0748870.1 STAS/SEC14 domain-containing protein [Polyangium mundeleinium]
MQHDARIFSIGQAHRVSFEPPDVVVLAWNGDVEPEHMLTFYDMLEEMAQGRQVLVMNDLTHSNDPGARTRKVATMDPRSRLVGALALLGANFRLRVIVAMMDKAVRVFQGQTRRTACFEDELEARAWLATQRPHLAPIDLASAY